MRILLILGGIVSLGLGVLLCVPAAFLVWQEISARRSARNASFVDLVSGNLPRGGVPSEIILEVGGLKLFGWRLWAFAAGLVLAGVALAGFGIWALWL